VTESDGSDENLKLEDLFVVAQLVLETLMILMMIHMMIPMMLHMMIPMMLPMMTHMMILYQKEPTVIYLVRFQTAHVLGGR